MEKQLHRAFVVFLLMVVILPVPFSHGLPPSAGLKHSIVIDPAHGGSDTGVKLSEKMYEKDVTLLIAVSLQRELQKSERYQVRLTRDADEEVSLSARAKTAKTFRPDIFIGLHVNAGFGKNSSGYELYFPGFNLPASSLSPPKNESSEILMDMTKNKYLNSSVRLSQSIQRNMERVFPRKSRGLRDAPIVIIEDLQIPAVVMEIGFATNAADREKITDGDTQKAVVRALGNGIKEYFR